MRCSVQTNNRWQIANEKQLNLFEMKRQLLDWSARIPGAQRRASTPKSFDMIQD